MTAMRDGGSLTRRRDGAQGGITRCRGHEVTAFAAQKVTRSSTRTGMPVRMERFAAMPTSIE